MVFVCLWLTGECVVMIISAMVFVYEWFIERSYHIYIV